MSSLTPEGKVKKRLADMLRRNKYWYFMPANNGFGKSGIPDFVVIVHGMFVGIECKSDKSKKPTALQIERAKEIRNAGGLWYLVYDADTIAQVEKALLRL